MESRNAKQSAPDHADRKTPFKNVKNGKIALTIVLGSGHIIWNIPLMVNQDTPTDTKYTPTRKPANRKDISRDSYL